MRRLLRYTGVNLVSLVLDYGIFLPLTYATGLPVMSSIVAYVAALTLNYRLSRLYVFGSDGSHKGEKRLFAQFLATAVLGVVLTATFTGLGIYSLGLHTRYREDNRRAHLLRRALYRSESAGLHSGRLRAWPRHHC